MAPDHLLTWLIGGLCALAFALGPGTAVASATDGGSPAPVTPTTAPAPTPPADSTVVAASQQAAAAVAQAVQHSPVNIAIPVKVLSPGDSGPVTQANVSTSDAQAVNVSQAWTPAPAADAPQPAATQPAATQQSAAAVAQSTQVAPANIYIPVSILSPGDHGPVTQVNVSSAAATATNVAQTAGQVGGTATDQAAGAAGGAVQHAPSNVATPVTIGGVDVGDHPPSQPWVWSWTWELDCSSAAPPPMAQLGPIIAQVTGGAWQWDWTWTCAPDPSGGHTAPGPSGGQPGAGQATPAVAAAPADQRVAGGALSQTAAPGMTAGSPQRPAVRPRARRAHTKIAVTGTGGVPADGAAAIAAGFLPLAGGDISALSLIPPAVAQSPVRTKPARRAPAAVRAPGRPPSGPPGPTTPTLFSAGAAGGSGPGPLSVGLAALIGAFCLSVPRLGARARTQLVHRSPQAVPERKHRPG